MTVVPPSPSSSGNESSDSDTTLERLLLPVEAHTDGKYHCALVNAPDHSCEFVADRKCMLR